MFLHDGDDALDDRGVGCISVSQEAEGLAACPEGGAAYAYESIAAGGGLVEFVLEAFGVKCSGHCAFALAVFDDDVVALCAGGGGVGGTLAGLAVGEGVLAVGGADVGGFGDFGHEGYFFQGVILCAPCLGDVIIYEVCGAHGLVVGVGVLYFCED